MGIVSAFFPRKFAQRGSEGDPVRAWFDESVLSGEVNSGFGEDASPGTAERKVTQTELRALFRTRLQTFE